MKIAILDYDNTLSTGYSRYEQAFLLEKAGKIRHGIGQELKDLQESYERGDITYNTKFKDDKAIFARYYKDLKRVDLSRSVRDDMDLESMLLPGAKDLIQRLKDAGYMTVVVSGCWDYILEEVQDVLDFDSFFGTEFEIDDGKLTGEYVRIVDEKLKDSITRELLISADTSIGVGDSMADMEFLEKVDVGYLRAHNPDAEKYAREKGVKVVQTLDEIEL